LWSLDCRAGASEFGDVQCAEHGGVAGRTEDRVANLGKHCCEQGRTGPGQVSARSSHLYPIYHKKSSLKELRALLQQASGENGEAKRWTNFAFRGRMGEGGGFRGGFEGMDSATNRLINLRIEDKQPSVAALTLGFATQAQIVPEDGIDLKANLELKNVTPEE